MRVTESTSHNLSRPPRLHGRYLVCRLLGKGAQARVYLAHDTRLRQWRAVKVLAANFLDDEYVRARFDQEARAMARLSHPSLLRVVDIDQDGRTPFMVMELARGGAVTDWIKRHGPLPPVLASRVTQRCCDGLAHAHMTGVVHRDVKPHNLLIREDGSVVLTDFGIAQVDENHQLTETGTIMGTFAFMAPEQRSDAKSVDLRADVYSLGATLYTMLTGRTSPELFFAESRDNLLNGVPEALRPIILTACRYEREQRYASMGDFHTALERRIAKLPRDPGEPHLATSLLALPDGPPQWLDPDSGVEELSRVLLTDTEEPPTVIPTSREADTYEGASYSGGLPYRMPAQRSFAGASGHNSIPSASATWDPARSAPASSGVIYQGAPRPSTTWSERSDYIDPGTVDAPLPETHPTSKPVRMIQAPLSGSSQGSTGFVFLLKRSSPVALAFVLLGSLLASVMIIAMAGIAAKAFVSHERASASRTLVLVTNDEAGVVRDLVKAGADEARLQERWTQFQEAPSSRQPASASAFIEAVELEATRVGMTGLPLSHITQLGRARRDWEDAESYRTWVNSTLPARLTGSLGSW